MPSSKKKLGRSQGNAYNPKQQDEQTPHDQSRIAICGADKAPVVVCHHFHSTKTCPPETMMKIK